MKPHFNGAGYLAVAITLAAAGLPGRASTTVFTSSTAFITALGTASQFTEGFFPFAPDNPMASWSRGTIEYQFTTTAEAGSLIQSYGDNQTDNNGLASDTANKSITVTFPKGGPRAVGGRFFLSNGVTGGTAAFKSGSVTVTVQPGDITQTFSPTSDLAGSFRGFISTDLITSITISTTAGWNVTLDDLTVSNGRSISITQQPTLTAIGAVITPSPTVSVVDASGVPYNGPVTVSRPVYAGTWDATLGGTTTVNAVNGVATFSDLSINKTGFGYKLTAAAEFVQMDSAAFNIPLASYPGRTVTSPTASIDGVVYCGDSAGILHAINSTTGATIFNRDIKGSDGVAPANSSRKAIGRLTRWNLAGTPRIFCVSSDNYLMVFATNGTPVWTAQLEGGGTSVDASAMAFNDGSNDYVYVASCDGSQTTVSKVSSAGSVMNHQHFPGAASTSSVSVYGNSIFFSTPAGSYRLQASDLTIRNSFGAGVAAPFVASTGSGNPIAIMVTSEGFVNAYSANTGAALSSFGTAGAVDLSVGLYTSYTQFATALSSSALNLETFDTLADLPDSPWTSPDNNGLHFTAAATGGLRLNDPPPPNMAPRGGPSYAPGQSSPSLGTNAPGESITLTFPAGVKAVLGSFALVDDAGNNAVGDTGTITLTLNDGNTTTIVPGEFWDSYAWSDRGFISANDITSLTISTTSTTSYLAMDDVAVSDYAAPSLRVTAAPFVYGGKVYIGGLDNQVYCVNLADGSAAGYLGSTVLSSRATYSGAGSITSGIGIYPAGPSVVYGSTNGTVFATFAGAQTYSYATWAIGSPIRTAPAWDPISHSFSITADDGNLYQIPFE